MSTSLVTGAAGFVGQHLVRELLRAGETVVGGTLGGAVAAPGVLSGAEIAAVRWVPLDVTSSREVTEALRGAAPDRIYHLAGQSSVGQSFDDVLGTWEVNATGTARLLHAAAEHAGRATRVLVVSSAEVYGVVPEAEQPIAESRPKRPASPYGASKAAAEMAALQVAVAASAVEVVVARSFNHTGPGQSTSFALPNWAAQLARMSRGELAPVLHVGNLEIRRDLLDVRDVVRAYRLLVERGENAGVYNVCSGCARRLRDVVDELIALSATGVRVEVDPERLRTVDVPLLVGDPSRLRGLGWRPDVPWTQTLADLLRSVEAVAA